MFVCCCLCAHVYMLCHMVFSQFNLLCVNVIKIEIFFSFCEISFFDHCL